MTLAPLVHRQNLGKLIRKAVATPDRDVGRHATVKVIDIE
jgi:hypothetical protein